MTKFNHNFIVFKTELRIPNSTSFKIKIYFCIDKTNNF